jgi:hypothetical protein
MSFKVGDIVVFLTETVIQRIATHDWPEERCLNSISLIIEVFEYRHPWRPVYTIMMVSGLQIRKILIAERDLLLLAAA